MDWYPRSGPPRPVKDGLRVESRRGAIGSKWWSRRWVEALEAITDPRRIQRGRRYARSGQVAALEPTGGGVTARVQGSRSRPYKVRIELEALGDDAWEAVLDALAERAGFAAALLAGDVPQEIEGVFTSVDAPLLPQDEDDLQTDCSCPDWANPCKHVAAVHYVLAEALDNDPFLLFVLRGRDRDAVLSGLRTRRAQAVEKRPAQKGSPPTSDIADPERPFYHQPTGAAAAVQVRIEPNDAPTDLLAALGPPPVFSSPRVDGRLLDSVYERAARWALDVAYNEGSPEKPLEDEQPGKRASIEGKENEKGKVAGGKDWQTRRVHASGHIMVQNSRFHVGREHAGTEVDVRITPKGVRVRLPGGPGRFLRWPRNQPN